MSYIDQENGSRRVAIGGVVLLHIAVGYALISGLAITVIQHVPKVFIAEPIPDDKPPPRHDDPPPPPKHHVAQDDKLVVEKIVDVDLGSGGFTMTKGPDVLPPVKPPVLPPQQQKISKARDAIVGPGRNNWVTNDDYPAGALHNEEQGVVGINVAIGTDGRVTGCEVTASSGSSQLDQATCRLYARRARFQPALDDDGQPTPSHHSDRIRWQIPE